ncbi:maleylpyruvate isomerase family mycothiol-dependent enzyme [Nocardioides acrostichi]|uniref:Maleylpyruvate isomerase family mycothiol-dependent enzyme n=1 Tax=Nocardioides acrostichi TaxID=2784339 RepID=A0A930UUU9_9ACTN|nr:maleylpyruvate isomerase family mycothiol-dependent enzyme [Nocardioides acrostichi]MBF4161268.1 maleylpyruvate isomerase family mycothiol-dependent enzyme [Nocardioides acrostichi]
MSDDAGPDAARLRGYIDAWWTSVQDLCDLLDTLDPDEWSAPTDLPGWDVKAVASHTAHLEVVLATGQEEHAEVPEAPHITSLMGTYTEIGVINRRDTPTSSIVQQIREATGVRREQLAELAPSDAAGTPDRTPGGVPWSWGTLLRNRPLDVWMHEQDVRRAVDRPGGLDTAGAQHTADYLRESIGFVLAKKAGAPAGTSMVLEVEGSEPWSVQVGDDGKARPCARPADPTVVMRVDRETFIRLAGGRGDVDTSAVVIEGDPELGARVLDALATTP